MRSTPPFARRAHLTWTCGRVCCEPLHRANTGLPRFRGDSACVDWICADTATNVPRLALVPDSGPIGWIWRGGGLAEARDPARLHVTGRLRTAGPPRRSLAAVIERPSSLRHAGCFRETRQAWQRRSWLPCIQRLERLEDRVRRLPEELRIDLVRPIRRLVIVRMILDAEYTNGMPGGVKSTYRRQELTVAQRCP